MLSDNLTRGITSSTWQKCRVVSVNASCKFGSGLSDVAFCVLLDCGKSHVWSLSEGWKFHLGGTLSGDNSSQCVMGFRHGQLSQVVVVVLLLLVLLLVSRDSSVGIATKYVLGDPGIES